MFVMQICRNCYLPAGPIIASMVPAATAVQHGTRCNSGTDNACYVGAHGMHQQEVGRISLLTYDLGYTGSHRNCGYARGSDQRIHFTTGRNLHQLAKETTHGRAGCESNQT